MVQLPIERYRNRRLLFLTGLSYGDPPSSVNRTRLSILGEPSKI